MSNERDNDLLTLEELSRRLRVNPSWVRSNPGLPRTIIHDEPRFNLAVVIAYLRAVQERQEAERRKRREYRRVHPRARRLRGRQGWVYLLQVVNGPTKIGISVQDDPQIRIKNIMGQLPDDAVLLAVAKTKDARELERSLHEKYASLRRKNEWFNLDMESIQQILAMREFAK